jgi:tRNA pseudouridine38-40 synthase
MRYFIEVSYDGTVYKGFQSQRNANTIQAEVEKALQTLLKQPIKLTGSSRTDAGVHALQNYFHFDFAGKISPKITYNLNAVLPSEIVIRNIISMKDESHCRFDALNRRYKYYIYQSKNPFLRWRAYYYPYKLDLRLLNEAAALVKEYRDFTSFSKRNTQVKSFICEIIESNWEIEDNQVVYTVKANRFLRGMVRGLVATMLKVGTKKITISDFRKIIEAKDCSKADFSAPPAGLYLTEVNFPKDYF